MLEKTLHAPFLLRPTETVQLCSPSWGRHVCHVLTSPHAGSGECICVQRVGCLEVEGESLECRDEELEKLRLAVSTAGFRGVGRSLIWILAQELCPIVSPADTWSLHPLGLDSFSQGLQQAFSSSTLPC